MPEIPIKYLKYIDNTGKVQKAYGITVLKAVYDTDGNTLDEILQTYDNKVGDTSSLTTTANTDLVSAINEVDGNVGDLSGLSTTAKNNLVAAVNELNQNMNTYDTQTIESFSGNVISSGSIRIEKKNGWCHINGRLVLSDTIADSTQILSGIPKPKNGALNMTVMSTSITFSRALYIGISSDGVMSARWGSANTHYIDISYCYIE